MNKKEIRQQILQYRKNLSIQYIEDISVKICNIAQKVIDKFAQNIGLYYPIKGEINCLTLINLLPNKNFSLPKIDRDHIYFCKWSINDEIIFNKFLIPEPAQIIITVPDIIIVPLLAFDINGHRIGYGKGFYDKYLANFNGQSIGLATEAQKFADLYSENHDVPLDYIVTEAAIYHKSDVYHR